VQTGTLRGAQCGASNSMNESRAMLSRLQVPCEHAAGAASSEELLGGRPPRTAALLLPSQLQYSCHLPAQACCPHSTSQIGLAPPPACQRHRFQGPGTNAGGTAGKNSTQLQRPQRERAAIIQPTANNRGSCRCPRLLPASFATDSEAGVTPELLLWHGCTYGAHRPRWPLQYWQKTGDTFDACLAEQAGGAAEGACHAVLPCP
jgi:hypothetical protein